MCILEGVYGGEIDDPWSGILWVNTDGFMRALETVREKGTGAGDGSYSHRKHIGLGQARLTGKRLYKVIRTPSAYYTQG